MAAVLTFNGGLQLGESVVQARRNPLDMIKSSPPLLSSEKRKAPQRPLRQLEDEAGSDHTCVWRRVSARALPKPFAEIQATSMRGSWPHREPGMLDHCGSGSAFIQCIDAKGLGKLSS